MIFFIKVLVSFDKLYNTQLNSLWWIHLGYLFHLGGKHDKKKPTETVEYLRFINVEFYVNFNFYKIILYTNFVLFCWLIISRMNSERNFLTFFIFFFIEEPSSTPGLPRA